MSNKNQNGTVVDASKHLEIARVLLTQCKIEGLPSEDGRLGDRATERIRGLEAAADVSRDARDHLEHELALAREAIGGIVRAANNGTLDDGKWGESSHVPARCLCCVCLARIVLEREEL